MKERPILFSGAMVRAILAGQKTQTRRVVKPQPVPSAAGGIYWDCAKSHCGEAFLRTEPQTVLGPCPYGQPGDRLWVRENGWQPPRLTSRDLREGADTWPKYIYDADGVDESEWCREHKWKRRPSIHMPRWASRLTLEVVSVRVERLTEISYLDALAEGYPHREQLFREIDPWNPRETVVWYRELWDSINGPGSWKKNQWVWVVEFRKVEGGAA